MVRVSLLRYSGTGGTTGDWGGNEVNAAEKAKALLQPALPHTALLQAAVTANGGTAGLLDLYIMSLYHYFMTRFNERGKPRKVSEPVQVYLDMPQRHRLDALAEHFDLSKSDVIRLGLESLEQQLSDPSNHPALRIVGIAKETTGAASDGDVARQHDSYLADSEIASWKRAPGRKRAR